MEGNEIIIEAIKSLITEEQIDAAIRESVQEQIEYEFGRSLKNEASRLAAEYANKKIDAVLDEIFGREVVIVDAWNSRKQYTSFEQYVKELVREKCSSQWGMESMVKRMIEDKIKDVCKKVIDENNADLADKAMRILAGEE